MIIDIANFLFQIYWYLLVARIIMSWVPSLQHSSFGATVGTLTEPYLSIFRGFIPPISMGGGGLDISPIVAFIAYGFIRSGAITILKWILGSVGLA